MNERPFVLPVDGDEVIRGEVRWTGSEDPPGSAVVVIHGFKGFKDWGFFPHVCRTLAADGHAVVSFNFSRNGVGEDPLEFTDLEAFARNTFSREVDEIHGILAALREGELPSGPPERIGLLGHSRGGADSLLAAREDGRVDALVTWAAVADFDRWDEATKEEWRRTGRVHVLNARTGQQMPLDLVLLEDFEANRDRLDLEAAAREVEVPWLVVHGEADPAVDVEDGRCLARWSGRARLEVIPEAGHTFEAVHPFQGATPELERALEVSRDHFRSHLR